MYPVQSLPTGRLWDVPSVGSWVCLAMDGATPSHPRLHYIPLFHLPPFFLGQNCHTSMQTTHTCSLHIHDAHTYTQLIHSCRPQVLAAHIFMQTTHPCNPYIHTAHTYMKHTHTCSPHVHAPHTYMQPIHACSPHVHASLPPKSLINLIQAANSSCCSVGQGR